MCRYRVNLLQIESLKLASTEDQFVLKEARRSILRRRYDPYTRFSCMIGAIVIMRLWYVAMWATSTDWLCSILYRFGNHLSVVLLMVSKSAWWSLMKLVQMLLVMVMTTVCRWLRRRHLGWVHRVIDLLLRWFKTTLDATDLSCFDLTMSDHLWVVVAHCTAGTMVLSHEFLTASHVASLRPSPTVCLIIAHSW